MSREERLEQMMSLVMEVDVQLGRLIAEEGDEEEFESLISALQELKEEIEYLS